MTFVLLQTHQADAQARFLEQYRGRPHFTALMMAIVGQVQLLENQVGQVATQCSLFGGLAVGAQLDGIGELVGVSRNGLSDSDYEVLIWGTIAEHSSHADNETLLSIAQTIFQGEGAAINSPFSLGHAHHRAPAVLGIEIGGAALAPTSWPTALNILRGSMAAGVALSWCVLYSGSDAFALDGPNAGLGFSDANVPGSGGALATTIYANPVA